MAIEHHGVERVTGVGVEESLLIRQPVLELNIEDSLQEHLVTDLVVKIPQGVLQKPVNKYSITFAVMMKLIAF